MDVLGKAVLGTARGKWLSDLHCAIDEAQWLAWRIGVVDGRNAQALELYVQLELVRAEVEALQGRIVPRERDQPPSSAFPTKSSDSFRDLATAGEGLQE